MAKSNIINNIDFSRSDSAKPGRTRRSPRPAEVVQAERAKIRELVAARDAERAALGHRKPGTSRAKAAEIKLPKAVQTSEFDFKATTVSCEAFDAALEIAFGGEVVRQKFLAEVRCNVGDSVV
jgi:hypothetical protein